MFELERRGFTLPPPPPLLEPLEECKVGSVLCGCWLYDELDINCKTYSMTVVAAARHRFRPELSESTAIRRRRRVGEERVRIGGRICV